MFDQSLFFASAPPLKPSVTALLNSANGSTVFVDSSSYAHPILNIGSAVASNAHPMLGASTSLRNQNFKYLAINGSGLPEFDITSGGTKNNDWTLDLTVYIESYNHPYYPTLASIRNKGVGVAFGGDYYPLILLVDSATGGIGVALQNTVGINMCEINSFIYGAIAPLNTNVSIRGEVYNNRLYLYLNGVGVVPGGVAIPAITGNPSTKTFCIGGGGSTSNIAEILGYSQQCVFYNNVSLTKGADSYTPATTLTP